MGPIFRFMQNQGPLMRMVSAVLLLAVFAVALFLGLFVFIAILGAMLVLGIALYLRLLWLRRKWTKRPPVRARGGVTLEGEYTRQPPEDKG
jgi:O-antigen/teichoic acid export membrane protein